MLMLELKVFSSYKHSNDVWWGLMARLRLGVELLGEIGGLLGSKILNDRIRSFVIVKGWKLHAYNGEELEGCE